jgi:hypothetical protein
VPVVLTLPPHVDVANLTVHLLYNASDPSAMLWNAGEPILPAGRYRAWVKDGGVPRNKLSIAQGGDYLPPTPNAPSAPTGVPAATLGFSNTVRSKTIYLEGVAPSAAKGDEMLTFSIEQRNNPNKPPPISSVAKITVGKVVAEPITNYLNNPAGLVTGDEGFYFMETIPPAIFDDHITWSATSGHVSFKNAANTGTSVIVQADSEGTSELTASFMGYQLPDLFHIAVKNLVDIPISVRIIKNNAGNAAYDMETVTNRVEVANLFLRQASVRLVIADIQYAENDSLYDFAYNQLTYTEMHMILNPSGGLKVFFVNTISDGNGGMASGVNVDVGTVIAKIANNTTLAHEVLHACGFPDIYETRNGKDVSGEGAVKSGGLSPKDWGAGYYDEATQLYDIIQRCIMYGYGDMGVDRNHIPHGSVYGVYNTFVNGETDIGYVEIGLDSPEFIRNPKHKQLDF